MVRGIAALAVMIGHLRNLFFVDFSEAAGNSNLPIKILYFVTGFGHEAVMVFFVLSGFLVGGSVIRGRMEDRWSWSLYLINRLTRLWVVLIPALILGSIWDHSGIHIFGVAGIYGGHAQANVGRVPVLPRLSASVMIGNALFVQTIFTPTFGSNGPLWSLSNEFWYYLLFPLMVLAYPLRKFDWSTVLYACAWLIIVFAIGWPICLYFLIWLLGAAINFAPERPARLAKAGVVIASVALLSVLAAIRFQTGDLRYWQDLLVGVAATALIFALLRIAARSKSGPYSRAAGRLAGISYTLYLVHLPALTLVSAWIVPRQRWQPDAAHLAVAAGLAAGALAYAFAIAGVTEYRTGAIRARVINAIGLHE